MIKDALLKIFMTLNDPSFLRNFFDNRFYLILVVIILMRIKYKTYHSMWLSALVNIPGTILHEFLHFFIGMLLNARPCNFTIWPKRGDDGNYVMGSVGFRNITFYNAIPASLAPLLLLPIGFYLNRYFLPHMPATFVNYVLYILLQTIIIENSIPSGADFRIARMYISGIIIYGFIFLSIFLML
ncbi:MAG: hypothetical protein E7012_02145 [Alphaproteobacteria bacterium]|nr:hypothetical protein [Alphaproteobacteria bacterium]